MLFLGALKNFYLSMCLFEPVLYQAVKKEFNSLPFHIMSWAAPPRGAFTLRWKVRIARRKAQRLAWIEPTTLKFSDWVGKDFTWSWSQPCQFSSYVNNKCTIEICCIGNQPDSDPSWLKPPQTSGDPLLPPGDYRMDKSLRCLMDVSKPNLTMT